MIHDDSRIPGMIPLGLERNGLTQVSDMMFPVSPASKKYETRI